MATSLPIEPRTPRPEARSGRRLRQPAEVPSQPTLSAFVASEVIPRLMVARGSRRPAQVEEGGGALPVVPLAQLALKGDAGRMWHLLEGLLARGVPPETLLVDLLAPAARWLGDEWRADRCDFMDVTMGLWRFQELAHLLSEREPAKLRRSRWRGLFSAFPDDQHGFGAQVLEQVFARAGWATWRIADGARGALLDALAQERFDIVALTMSCDCHIDAAPRLIGALRAVSSNPAVKVLIGGNAIGGDLALARRLGADGTASDATAAIRLAERLVADVRRAVTIG